MMTDKINDEFVTLALGKQKNIALIAHDGKKQEMLDWCEWNKEILSKHFLSGTGTTARMITERIGLPVRIFNSGPLGGDQQIGAKIVEGVIGYLRQSRECHSLVSGVGDSYNLRRGLG